MRPDDLSSAADNSDVGQRLGVEQRVEHRLHVAAMAGPLEVKGLAARVLGHIRHEPDDRPDATELQSDLRFLHDGGQRKTGCERASDVLAPV